MIEEIEQATERELCVADHLTKLKSIKYTIHDECVVTNGGYA